MNKIRFFLLSILTYLISNGLFKLLASFCQWIQLYLSHPPNYLYITLAASLIISIYCFYKMFSSLNASRSETFLIKPGLWIITLLMIFGLQYLVNLQIGKSLSESDDLNTRAMIIFESSINSYDAAFKIILIGYLFFIGLKPENSTQTNL